MKKYTPLMSQAPRQRQVFPYLAVLLSALCLNLVLFISPARATPAISQTVQQTQPVIRYIDRSKGERNLPVVISQPDYVLPENAQLTTRKNENIRHGVSGQPFLWRITHPNINSGIRSSYIFGTIHIDDPRVMNLPDSVLRRLSAANTLMLELELNDASSVNILRKMLFTDGRNLQQVLGESEYNEVTRALNKAGNSLPQNTLSILKPWAAMLILIRPENKSGTFLDKHLADIARSSGIRIEGLETIDEQLSVFDDLMLEDQIKLLRAAMSALDSKKQDYQDLLDAYISGDFERLLEVSQQQEPDDKELAALLKNRLIDTRNTKMFNRFISRLQQGNVFIAIGSLHLPGDQGLLNKIRQAGFRVERITEN